MYKILSITRTPPPNICFRIKLYDLSNRIIIYKKICKSLNNEIIKGRYYIGDMIKIISDNNNIIKFEKEFIDLENNILLVSNENEKYSDSNLNESNSQESNDLIYKHIDVFATFPFLNDIKPFETRKLKNIELYNLGPELFKCKYGDVYTVDRAIKLKKKSVNLIGKVLYKTRINNNFFVLIFSSSDCLLKIFCWNLKFSSIKVNDVIVIIKYKNCENQGFHSNKIVYNEFNELNYFNCSEIKTVKDTKIYLAQDVEQKNDFDKFSNLYKYKFKPVDSFLEIHSKLPFYSLKGIVTYLSILLRKRNKYGCYLERGGKIYEYFLMRICDTTKSNGMVYSVVVFICSTVFYDVKVGDEIVLINTRKIERGNEFIYCSSIYTDMEIINSVNLNNSEIKNIGKNNSEIEKNTENQMNDFKDVFDENESVLPDLVETLKNDFSKNVAFYENEISDSNIFSDVDSKNDLQNELLIYGAIGFLPDNYISMSDMNVVKYENINGNDYEVGDFFKPYVCEINEIYLICNNLIINESRKVCFKGKLVSFDLKNIYEFDENETEYNSFISENNTLSFIKEDGNISLQTMDVFDIEYSENGMNQIQNSGFAIIENNEQRIRILIFKNCFCESNFVLNNFINLEAFWVVECMRVEEDNVMVYLTGIIKNE
ncbi:DUF5088 domain-containing protein [Hamiltosporidium magnivora]|uniref:DUF5088 domain-containing protein n=1 Tax=Hamiltosporidium magnivora TaxID=148818 RepID=A0A4Q9LG65_9MICR|nr:DUF5088 domain-containing protein [Hamiltosporidium magnivora]